jgi:chlorite dismutase
MSEDQSALAPVFAQFLGLKADSAWRRLPDDERAAGREAFARVVDDVADTIPTESYSTIGFKNEVDLLLWRTVDAPLALQEMTARLLQSGIGRYLAPAISLFGFTRASVYTKRQTTQEQAIHAGERKTYLIVYPFSKTTDWYLMSKDARQGMMNEHMRIGHTYADVSQVLLYATGLDDQEFVVAYETDDLARFQSLVIDLRATEARRYTLRDTPIVTGVHRPLREALALIG